MCLASCGGGGAKGTTTPPRTNAVPVFSGQTDLSFEEGNVISFPLDVSDPDGDALTIAIVDTGDAAFFYRSSDRVISAAKMFDFENPEDGNGDNVYELDVSAKDALATTTAHYTVTVTNRPGRGYFEEQGVTAILGTQEFQPIGKTVAAAGDIDGDTLPELLVGMPDKKQESGGFTYSTGAAYLLAGAMVADTGEGFLQIGDNTPDGMVVFEGSLGSDPISNVGSGLRGLGDLDGDGLPEIAIGASSKVFVVRGAALRSAMQGTGSIPLTTLTSDGNGLRIAGSTTEDSVSGRIGSIGDLDGDNLSELLICAPYAHVQNQYNSSTYVVFGAAIASRFGGGTAMDIGQAVANAEAVRLNGADSFSSECTAVDEIGDFDGDGVSDIAIGEDRNAADFTRTHIVFGDAILNARAGSRTILLDGLEASGAGVTLVSDATLDRFGFAVSSAGDFNGDGFDDVLIGAPETNNQPGTQTGYQGAVYVFFGTNTPYSQSVAVKDIAGDGLGIEILGEIDQNKVGTAVAKAGDLNGDGYGDILLGAPGADIAREGAADLFIQAGKAYVLFGSNNISGHRILLDEPFDGVTILSINEQSDFGSSLAILGPPGNLDADTVPDLLIGARRAHICVAGVPDWVADTGAAYAISGQRILDAHEADGVLDLADVLPHLKVWTAAACDKPGLDWFK